MQKKHHGRIAQGTMMVTAFEPSIRPIEYHFWHYDPLDSLSTIYRL